MSLSPNQMRGKTFSAKNIPSLTKKIFKQEPTHPPLQARPASSSIYFPIGVERMEKKDDLVDVSLESPEEIKLKDIFKVFSEKIEINAHTIEKKLEELQLDSKTSAPTNKKQIDAINDLIDIIELNLEYYIMIFKKMRVKNYSLISEKIIKLIEINNLLFKSIAFPDGNFSFKIINLWGLTNLLTEEKNYFAEEYINIALQYTKYTHFKLTKNKLKNKKEVKNIPKTNYIEIHRNLNNIVNFLSTFNSHNCSEKTIYLIQNLFKFILDINKRFLYEQKLCIKITNLIGAKNFAAEKFKCLDIETTEANITDILFSLQNNNIFPTCPDDADEARKQRINKESKKIAKDISIYLTEIVDKLSKISTNKEYTRYNIYKKVLKINQYLMVHNYSVSVRPIMSIQKISELGLQDCISEIVQSDVVHFCFEKWKIFDSEIKKGKNIDAENFYKIAIEYVNNFFKLLHPTTELSIIKNRMLTELVILTVYGNIFFQFGHEPETINTYVKNIFHEKTIIPSLTKELDGVQQLSLPINVSFLFDMGRLLYKKLQENDLIDSLDPFIDFNDTQIEKLKDFFNAIEGTRNIFITHEAINVKDLEKGDEGKYYAHFKTPNSYDLYVVEHVGDEKDDVILTKIDIKEHYSFYKDTLQFFKKKSKNARYIPVVSSYFWTENVRRWFEKVRGKKHKKVKKG